MTCLLLYDSQREGYGVSYLSRLFNMESNNVNRKRSERGWALRLLERWLGMDCTSDTVIRLLIMESRPGHAKVPTVGKEGLLSRNILLFIECFPSLLRPFSRVEPRSFCYSVVYTFLRCKQYIRSTIMPKEMYVYCLGLPQC